MTTLTSNRITRKSPAPVLEEQVFLSIARTAEQLSWAVVETLHQADLTPTQYNALRILRGAGPDGASCTEVSDRMVTKDSDITRLLDRLEARDLISRERGGRDRRRIQVRITDQGLKVLSDLDEPVIQSHKRQLAHMKEHDLSRLVELLAEVRKEK